VALLPAALAAPAGAQQLQEALAAQAQVDRDAAESQRQIDAMRERTQDAEARADQANAEAESLERFNRALEEQVRTQEADLASLNRQLVEIETTNREVQPLMQQMVDTLARFIELDVPFLIEERTERVRNLQNLMGRADVTISEKYRLILEAYQIELDYGQTFEAYEGRLGEGADARTVEFAKLGRVSLMYRTLDGTETGYWDANQRMWVVDNSYLDTIEAAIRVARGDDTADLLIVPVPPPQEVRS
jgi:chromosome segregation ATPase